MNPSPFCKNVENSNHLPLQRENSNYDVMIDRRNSFDQPIKNDIRTYDNIRKIAICQGDDNKTGCLLDFPYFKKYYEMITIDLSNHY